MSDMVHLNIKSVYSYNPIVDLVAEAYSESVCIFEHKIGIHIPIWRHVTIGNQIIYSIDNIAICAGEICFIKSKVFRPRWIPDNTHFNTFIDFAQAMCCQTFSKKWAMYMRGQHRLAINQKKWIFVVCVVFRPMYYYISNKSVIDKRVKEIIDYEDDQLKTSSRFYMQELIDD